VQEAEKPAVRAGRSPARLSCPAAGDTGDGRVQRGAVHRLRLRAEPALGSRSRQPALRPVRRGNDHRRRHPASFRTRLGRRRPVGCRRGGISESWTMPSWQLAVANSRENRSTSRTAEAFETETKSASAPFTTPTFCDGTLNLASGTLCREMPDVSAQADEFTGSVTIYASPLGYAAPPTGGRLSAEPRRRPPNLGRPAGSRQRHRRPVRATRSTGSRTRASPARFSMASRGTRLRTPGPSTTSSRANNDDFGSTTGSSFRRASASTWRPGLGHRS